MTDGAEINTRRSCAQRVVESNTHIPSSKHTWMTINQWRFNRDLVKVQQRRRRGSEMPTEFVKEAMLDVMAIGLKSNLMEEQHNYLHLRCPNPEPTSARDTVYSLQTLHILHVRLGDLPRALNHAGFLTTTCSTTRSASRSRLCATCHSCSLFFGFSSMTLRRPGFFLRGVKPVPGTFATRHP
jgi:hypothetical protein